MYAVTNFWLCTINDFFRVIVFASLVNFTVCVICCNLDSQVTPTTENLQASTNSDGLPGGIEDKPVVNHFREIIVALGVTRQSKLSH